MAEKGWTTQAATAAGIAAGAGAAQLGLGYGLGVITWPATAAEAESVWLGSLGWAAWITASATVLGAVIAGRLRPDMPGRWRALWRFALALSAALGALVAVALVALPARSAVRADTFSPQMVAGGYALAGLVAGLVVAFWAVSSGPVAANLIGTALWLWALAVAGVAAELASGRDFATYLTSWQFAESVSPIRYGGIYWPSALLTLVAAFVIGLVSPWPAARRGGSGLGTAISGAVGPLLVAFSFLTLAPQLTQAMGPLQSAYLMAPYAVLAGLAGSALTVAVAQNRHHRRTAVGAPALSSAPAQPAAVPAHSVPAQPGPTQPVPAQSGSAQSGPAQPQGSAPKSGGLAKATGRATASTEVAAPAERPAARPAEKPAAPATSEPSPAFADPEIAAAARPAKRGAPRKPANGRNTEGSSRSTITPPPVNPTVAQINPEGPQH